MKKLRNILFVLVALLLVVVRVDAADYGTPILGEDVYKEQWKKAYATEEDESFNETIVVEDGVIAVGSENIPVVETEGTSVSYTDSYRGLIVKYDDNGEVVWKTDHESDDTYFYDVVEVKDGYVVFGEYDDLDTDLSDFVLIKYDFAGTKVWETILSEDFENFKYIVKISTYNDLVVVTFGEDVYVYDITGKQIKVLNNLVYPVATMDEDGIYVVGYDMDATNLTAHLTLEKYNYEYELVTSSVISESVYDSTNNTFSKLDTAIEVSVVDDRIVVSVIEYGTFVYRTLILDDEYKVVKEIDYETNDYEVYDIEPSKDGFVTLFRYTKNATACAPQSSLVTEDRRPEYLKGSDCPGTVYVVYKYDVDGNKIWEIEVPFTGYGIGSNGVELAITGYSTKDTTDFANEGFYDAYLYKYAGTYDITTKDDGNGTVTVTKVESNSGEEVEFIVTPKEGYKLVKVTVTTSDGTTVEYTDYKFTMPNDNVEIYAEFEKIPDNPNTGLSNPFVICGSILGLALVGSLIVKKKKFI